MSDVNETLQDLMERRLRELGWRRGRGESFSLREAYQRMLEQYEQDNELHEPGRRTQPPTYEVFRRIRNGHSKISDPTAVALATMLDVDVNEVYAAAGVPPRLGRFELPTRADRLDDAQRKVVLAVIDAILEAGATQTSHFAGSGKTHAVAHHLAGADRPGNLVLLSSKEHEALADAVRAEIEKQLGGEVSERLVRVAVRTALDQGKHPELYEDTAARESTE